MTLNSAEKEAQSIKDTLRQALSSERADLQTKTGLLHDWPSTLVHSTDVDMQNILPQLTSWSVKSDKFRLGLVVGTGAIYSVLPELADSFGIQTVLVVDQNRFIHKWLRQAGLFLGESKFAGECYWNTYDPSKNPFCWDLAYKRHYGEKSIQKDLASEITSLGEYHYLFSSKRTHNQFEPGAWYKRFAACQQAYKNIPINHIWLNLLNESGMDQLANVLNDHQAEIVFANWTNVRPCINANSQKRFCENLRKLPVAMDAAVVYSQNKYNQAKSNDELVVRPVCKGLEDYLTKTHW